MKASELIGRERELEAIRRALLDPDIRAVVLRGPAGSGKTALAEAALALRETTGALIGRGKYAEGEAQPPFEPLMAGLAGLAGRALDQLYEPDAGLASLREMLGEGLQILAAAGFRLEGLQAPRRPIDIEPGASVRLVHASLGLLGWLRGFGLPLLLFLDDWHRAPADARRLAHALRASAQGALHLVLCERAEGSGGALPEDVRLVSVDGLSFESCYALLASKIGPDRAATLASRLTSDGPALPFDLLEAAEAAEREKGLPVGALADGARRSRARWLGLRPEARRLAVAAAMWGDVSPIAELAASLGLSAEAAAVAQADLSQAGLTWDREGRIGFHHDRLRAGVLDAATPEMRRSIARQVSEHFVTLNAETWEALGSGALHLRLLCGLEDADPELWLERFVDGATRARASADAATATAFAEAAHVLNARAPAPTLELRRRLFREAVMAAADRGLARETASRSRALVATSATPVELAEDYARAVNALRWAGDLDESWRMAREGLARLGFRAPSGGAPRLLGLELIMWRMRRVARGRRRRRNDPAANATERLLTAAGYAAYGRSPALAAQLAVRVSGQTREGATPYWMSVDAYVSGIAGDLAGAARLGAEADHTASREGPGRAAALYRAALYGWGWARPASELAERGEEIQALALAEGDLGTAAMAARLRAVCVWRSCKSLPEAAENLKQLEADLSWLGDAEALAIARLYRQGFAWLQDPAAHARPEEPELRVNPGFALELRSLDGDWLGNARWSRELNRGWDSRVLSAVTIRFHAALSAFGIGERPYRADLRLIEAAARLNPHDHAGKWLLLRAAGAEARGDPAALKHYTAALEAAAQGGSRFEAGLAAEIAAQAGRRLGAPSFADSCASRAEAIWSEWGALGRVSRRPDRSPAAEPFDARLSDAEARWATAERAQRAKSRFLADVAHEIRTPLQGLQGLLDVAAETGQPLDLPAFREVFGSLKTVVDDLTDYGALSSGEAPLHPTPSRLDEIVRSECAVACGQGGLGRLTLELDAATPGWVLVDGGRVRQVLRNLLSNAAKYAEAAPVRVRLGPAEVSGFAELIVEDDGPGLGPNPALVFEPFERGARDGDGRGLGLGLALARRTAERLQGALTAEAGAHGGARFRFRFAAPPTEEPQAPGSHASPRLRVLVAEDVALNRQAVAALLRADGHVVVEAADGLQTASLVREGGFDLVLLDLRMPGLSGLEVLERMGAEDAPTPRPTVLITTASSDPDLPQRAALLGAAGVLRKPITAAALRSAIAGTPAATGAALSAELERLRDEAAIELKRATAALSAGAALTAAEAHRLSGLAAQFGFTDLADAAEALEAALLDGDGARTRATLDTLVDRVFTMAGSPRDETAACVSKP